MIFKYDPADTFVIFGAAHWCSYQNDTLCIFEPKEKDSGPPKTFTREEINFLRGSNNWRYLPGPRARERLNRAAKSGSKALRDAHPDDRDAAIFAYMECMNLELFRNAGAIVLTLTSLKENWKDILGAFLAKESVRNIDDGPVVEAVSCHNNASRMRRQRSSNSTNCCGRISMIPVSCCQSTERGKRRAAAFAVIPSSSSGILSEHR